MPTILLSAGDRSGEMHAADLVRALRARHPDARFIGMGGAAMADAGVELLVDQRELAVGGLFEIVSSLPRIVRARQAMLRGVAANPPDLTVLIDSGGFNLPLAHALRQRSRAPILYYVAPQVWAWRPGRVRKLAKRVDRIAVILPFEPAFYARYGIEVDYVGHPVVDRMAQAGQAGLAAHAGQAKQAGTNRSNERSVPRLGLFPGSRRNEVARHLPIQLEAWQRLRAQVDTLADLEAVVGIAASLDPNEVERRARALLAEASLPIRFVRSEGSAVLDEVDVALVKPGTITVEAMLRQIPMVIMGRAQAASAWIARRSLRVPWLGMPNLIAGAEIVPELLQAEATPDRIAAALAPLFEGPERAAQIEGLDRAAQALGPPGATQRCADIVEEMLGTASA